MSDKLKGAVTKWSAAYGSGSTGGPWPAVMINPSPKGARLGGHTQNKHTIQSFEKLAGNIKQEPTTNFRSVGKGKRSR